MEAAYQLLNNAEHWKNNYITRLTDAKTACLLQSTTIVAFFSFIASRLKVQILERKIEGDIPTALEELMGDILTSENPTTGSRIKGLTEILQRFGYDILLKGFVHSVKDTFIAVRTDDPTIPTLEEYNTSQDKKPSVYSTRARGASEASDHMARSKTDDSVSTSALETHLLELIKIQKQQAVHLSNIADCTNSLDLNLQHFYSDYLLKNFPDRPAVGQEQDEPTTKTSNHNEQLDDEESDIEDMDTIHTRSSEERDETYKPRGSKRKTTAKLPTNAKKGKTARKVTAT